MALWNRYFLSNRGVPLMIGPVKRSSRAGQHRAGISAILKNHDNANGLFVKRFPSPFPAHCCGTASTALRTPSAPKASSPPKPGKFIPSNSSPNDDVISADLEFSPKKTNQNQNQQDETNTRSHPYSIAYRYHDVCSR
jgi:hypothetical protein